MNGRDEVLDRVTAANPLPNEAELPKNTFDSRPPLGLIIGKGSASRQIAEPQRSTRIDRRWRGPLVAAGTAAAILIVAVATLELLGTGQGDVADQRVEPTSMTGLPAPMIASTFPESWDPILGTAVAAAAPPAAECSAGTNPDQPGSVEQMRPDPRGVGNLAGAFDQRMGQVVFVDATGETWLFDVCTNSWSRPDPEGTPVPFSELYDGAGQPSGAIGQLVYDIDSDVTVMIGFDRVSVYDANANTWSQRVIEIGGGGTLGALYDPISGLIITSTVSPLDGERWDLWAYDVDTNIWILIGPVFIGRETPCCTQIDLLGYSPDLDRLILTTYAGDDAVTLLVDPRSGEMEIRAATDSPIVDLVWPGHAYGTGLGTVHVYVQDKRSVCWFDAATRSWPCAVGPPDTLGRDVAFGAIVGDPINNRVLLIHRVPEGLGLDPIDDVWGLDLGSGEWELLLAPSRD